LSRLLELVSGEQQTITLTQDELYECLSARRRWMVIRLLAGTYDDETETYIEVKQLARAFANTNHHDPTSQEVQRYYISLIQTHLPTRSVSSNTTSGRKRCEAPPRASSSQM
jgi:hypothetical protein